MCVIQQGVIQMSVVASDVSIQMTFTISRSRGSADSFGRQKLSTSTKGLGTICYKDMEFTTDYTFVGCDNLPHAKSLLKQAMLD